jgi:hypothetical protein
VSTTVAVPAPTRRPRAHALRIAAVSLAIAALLVVAFAVGRLTAATASPARVPAVPATAASRTPSTALPAEPRCRPLVPC